MMKNKVMDFLGGALFGVLFAVLAFYMI